MQQTKQEFITTKFVLRFCRDNSSFAYWRGKALNKNISDKPTLQSLIIFFFFLLLISDYILGKERHTFETYFVILIRLFYAFRHCRSIVSDTLLLRKPILSKPHGFLIWASSLYRISVILCWQIWWKMIKKIMTFALGVSQVRMSISARTGGPSINQVKF